MSKTITVTQKHIDTAIPKDSGHCMIADAIRDSIPDAKRVSVDLQTIRFSRNGKRYIYLSPRIAQDSLLRFDDEVVPTPFKFRLPQPSQVHDAVDHSKRKDLKATTKTRKIGKIGGGKRSGGGGGRGHAAPVKHGGSSPAIGALAGGAISGPKVRTGRIRRFGLRSMGRAEPEVPDAAA